jgi:K+ transporter
VKTGQIYIPFINWRLPCGHRTGRGVFQVVRAGYRLLALVVCGNMAITTILTCFLWC